VTAERPDTSIAVICGALYRADQLCQERLDEYKRMIAKYDVVLLWACRGVHILTGAGRVCVCGGERGPPHRGQSPSNDLLRTDSSVDIIYDGVKYSFTYVASTPDARGRAAHVEGWGHF
jgi:hypothetical protein